MQYQVPQFIEIEDKIFGQLTFKQFLYLVGGGAISYMIWATIPIKFIAFVVIIPVAGLFIALAFYKINGRPLIHTLEKGLYYFFANKLYVWKKINKPVSQTTEEDKSLDQMLVPKISDSKLKELTWSLDINSKIEQKDNQEKNSKLGLKF